MNSDINSSIFHPRSNNSCDDSSNSDTDSSNSDKECDQMESDCIVKRRRNDMLCHNICLSVDATASYSSCCQKEKSCSCNSHDCCCNSSHSDKHSGKKVFFTFSTKIGLRKIHTHKLNTEPGDEFHNIFRMQSFSFNKSCMLPQPYCQKDL